MTDADALALLQDVITYGAVTAVVLSLVWRVFRK
jgi:hypothetical protein